MAIKREQLELQVGIFVVLGMAVMAWLIITFGNFQQYFQKSYTITVEFENAGGIIKNSQVLFRGSKIGTVISRPSIANMGDTVNLTLRINGDVNIPKESAFRIGVYGLLGDRFVDVIPPEKLDGMKGVEYLKDGDFVRGESNKGLDELIAKLEEKLDLFDETIRDAKEKILTKEFIDDFHGSMANARSVLERADAFMAEAEMGRGPLHTVMKDKEMAADIKQFVRNLRINGILFYSDLTKETEEENSSSKTRGKDAVPMPRGLR